MYFYTSDSILVEITKPAYAWRQIIAYDFTENHPDS